jgi:hypothetical protein
VGMLVVNDTISMRTYDMAIPVHKFKIA